MPQPTDPFELTDDFERFHQRDDAFSRAIWDDDVKSNAALGFFGSYRVAPKARRGDGFAQRDFALRNAGWAISDIITDRTADEGRRQGFQAPIADDTAIADTRIAVEDPTAQAREIKRVAKQLGAELCGITAVDPRWHYATRVDTRDMSAAPNEIPEGATSVIVLGHAMDQALVATYPSALAGAATGLAYSHEAAIVIQLAAYIRGLGYSATASMNDSALVIPYAIQAGLGEYARNQLVITPELGPRLRFSKIFTDLPLDHDIARSLGVKAFCDICTRCADACPVKALPYGAPKTAEPDDRSAIKGVVKWTSDAVACFGFWAKLKSDCAICLRVCPFNRDFSKRRHRLWRRLALSRFRKIALWLDDRFIDRSRQKPSDWWFAQD